MKVSEGGGWAGANKHVLNPFQRNPCFCQRRVLKDSVEEFKFKDISNINQDKAESEQWNREIWNKRVQHFCRKCVHFTQNYIVIY